MAATVSDRPKARSLRPLRALVPFLRPYRGTLWAALGALLVASGAMLALPLAVRQLIDHEINRLQYRRAMQRLADNDADRHPLTVPSEN